MTENKSYWRDRFPEWLKNSLDFWRYAFGFFIPPILIVGGGIIIMIKAGNSWYGELFIFFGIALLFLLEDYQRWKKGKGD